MSKKQPVIVRVSSLQFPPRLPSNHHCVLACINTQNSFNSNCKTLMQTFVLSKSKQIKLIGSFLLSAHLYTYFLARAVTYCKHKGRLMYRRREKDRSADSSEWLPVEISIPLRRQKFRTLTLAVMDVSRWTTIHVLQCVDVDVIPALHCPFIFLEILHRNPGAVKPYTTDTQIAELRGHFQKMQWVQGPKNKITW